MGKEMPENDNHIISFMDLKAWQESRKLFFMVYQATKLMPKEELFSTVSQMRRAAMSVSSNIAEGFGRETVADKTHFYVMSRGSLTELQNQSILAHDVKLLNDSVFKQIEAQAELSHKLIVGLIKSIKRRK